MRTSPLYPLSFLLALVLTGCTLFGMETDGYPHQLLRIQTDRTEYAPTETVAVTFTNRGIADLLLISDGCLALDGRPLPHMTVQRQEGNDWEPGASYGCYAVYQPPTPIRPGDRYTVRFRVGVADALPSGTYRYVFDLRTGATLDSTTPLPDNQRISNTFVVVPP